jgi:hypothetical protein
MAGYAPIANRCTVVGMTSDAETTPAVLPFHVSVVAQKPEQKRSCSQQVQLVLA